MSDSLLIEGLRHHVGEEALWRVLDSKPVIADTVWAEPAESEADMVTLALTVDQTSAAADDPPATGKVRRQARDIWDLALLEISEE